MREGGFKSTSKIPVKYWIFYARGHGFDICHCYIDRSVYIFKVLFCQICLQHFPLLMINHIQTVTLYTYMNIIIPFYLSKVFIFSVLINRLFCFKNYKAETHNLAVYLSIWCHTLFFITIMQIMITLQMSPSIILSMCEITCPQLQDWYKN